MNDRPVDPNDLSASMETEEGKGMALVTQLLTASMDANYRTMDTLYQSERQHRMALEVLLEVFLDAADQAHMGTVRQYEDAIDIIRFKGPSGPAMAARLGLDFNASNWIEALASRHAEIVASF